MVDIGTIIGGGFKLIRQRPGSVAIWALIFAAMAVATQMMVMMQMRSMGVLDGTPDAVPNPAAMMTWMVPTQLLNFAVWIVTVVLGCAVYRSILRPSEGGFAGMRIGMDEVRVFGTGLILFIAVCIVMVVAMLLAVFVGLGLGLFAPGQSGPGMGVAVIGLLMLVLFLGSIFLWVRLSLALPLTFATRRIGIDQSWSLTRGHFWTLFLAYLVIAIITMVVGILVALPYLGAIFGVMAEAMRNPASAQQAQAHMMAAMFDRPLPILIGLAVLGGIAQALILAIGTGATATAARELLLANGEVLEDDADSVAAVFD